MADPAPATASASASASAPATTPAPPLSLDDVPEGPRRTAAAQWLEKVDGDPVKTQAVLKLHRDLAARDARVGRIRAELGDDYGAEDRHPYRPREFAVRRLDTQELRAIKVVRRNLHSTPQHPGDTPCPWRVTHYDRRGPSGHFETRTLDETARELVRATDGELVPGTLSAWSQTPEWAEGLLALEIIRQHNDRGFDSAPPNVSPPAATRPRPPVPATTRGGV